MNKKMGGIAGVFWLVLAFSAMIVPRLSMALEPLTPQVFKFGVFPYQSPKTLVEMYGPLADRLEKKLGIKVHLTSTPDTETFLSKARNGEYDLIVASPTVFYKLRPAGYKVIARGASTFYGGAIVRKESEIRGIEQLKGKKVAAIAEHSYAGYMFILPQLEAKGIDPRKDVDFQFMRNVDTLIYGVVNKKYDVGLLRLDTLELPAFAAVRDQVVVITRSPEIPQFPFVVKKSMDTASITAIQEILTALLPANPEEFEILKSMQVEKIIVGTDADYEGFYEQIKDTDFFKQP